MSFDIFERMIGNRDKDDMVFIKLTSEKESPLAYVVPFEIEISEDFSTSSFVVTLSMFDGAGTLMHYKLVDQDNTFYMEIGNSHQRKQILLDLKIVNIERTDDVVGKTESVAYRISMIHHKWGDIMNRKHNRAWVNARYSDVVREIAAECGFKKIDVYNTREVKESIIQPYFSNAEMLRYIQQRAKHAKALKHQYDEIFEFGLNIKGEFTFKTISDWIDEQTPLAIARELPVLTLQGVEMDEAKRIRLKAENKNVPPHFFAFDNSETYLNAIKQGGSRTKSMYYDFESGEFINQIVDYQNLSAWTLTDWGPQKKPHHEYSEHRFYGGSDRDTKFVAENLITNIINSENRFTISTEGTYELFLGDMIELIIPTYYRHPLVEDIVSQFFSGFYIISGVTHRFTMESNKYATDFDLIRHGYDGKRVEGYIKSGLGRFIGRRSDVQLS